MVIKRYFTNNNPGYMITEKQEKNRIKLVKHQMINSCWTPIGTYYRKNKCYNYYDLLLKNRKKFKTFIEIIKKWNFGFYLNHGINRKLSTMFVPNEEWFLKNKNILLAKKFNFSYFLRGIIVLNYAIKPNKLRSNGWMGMNNNPICDEIINNVDINVLEASNGNIYIVNNYPIQLKDIKIPHNITIQQLNNRLQKVRYNSCGTIINNPNNYTMPYNEWWMKNIYYNYIKVTNNHSLDWSTEYKNYQNNIRNRVNYIY
jgi:hypothetical protein